MPENTPGPEHLPVYVGAQALERLTAFCAERGLRSLALVADPNTYAALGRRVEEALTSAGFDLRTLILHGDDIGADAESAYQVLLGLDKKARTFVSVGSGTVTDVARFVSHRSNAEFISLPTAASVDGYTSIAAPMIIDGAKVTVNCHGPLAVFADLPTLCSAPRALTAAGFGDLIAKLTSVADWEIGYLLWDEPFDAEIARRARQCVWDCVSRLDALVDAECDGVEALFRGLIESGFCMLDFGETRPASGYEHHVSHFWEMKLLREGRHSVFHGAKVGVAVLASVALDERLRGLTVEEVQARLKEHRPNPSEDEAIIRSAYGAQSEQMLTGQQPFLEMTDEQHRELAGRIVARWDDVRHSLGQVPSSTEMRGWLERLGGATTPEALGLAASEYQEGLDAGHYFRTRLTARKLAHYLGL